MNQYLIGMIEFICVVLAILIVYDVYGKNRLLKWTNGVYSKAFVTGCGIVLIIFAFLGYELNSLITIANNTFSSKQTFFAIVLYILIIIDLCFNHAISSFDKSTKTYKNKLKDNLFFIEATFSTTLLPIYLFEKLHLFEVLKGWHPFENFVPVMCYSLFSVFIYGIVVWLIYNGLLKLLGCKHFHHFIKVINNITT